MVFDSNKITLKKKDYKDLGDKFVIYNVPIAAELVQPYSNDSGDLVYAFKPASEISKMVVEQVPITMRRDSPDHPPAFLTGSPTDFKAEYAVGFLSEPSKPRADANQKKRYADLVLFKNDLTKEVIDDYENGEFVDVSVGFDFTQDNTQGTHQGVRYDYVQRDIKLDHLAILLDERGNKGLGRMPSPIGGIGADTMKRNDAFHNEITTFLSDMQKKFAGFNKREIVLLLDDELYKIKQQTGDSMETLDSVKEQIKIVTAERDAAKKELLEKQNATVTDAQAEAKKTIDALTADKEKLQNELKTATDKLAVFEKKEKDALDAMRATLKEADKEHEKLYDEASDETIKEYHESLLKKQGDKGRNISADLMGPSKLSNLQNETERLKSYTSPKKKE